LYYHHETQPLPNPLSALFHRLPKVMLRGGVAFSHFVQIVAPFGLFLPQPIASGAGALIIAHQLILIVSGNYAWLNWLTVVLCIPLISDRWWAWLPIHPPADLAPVAAHQVMLYVVAAAVAWLSIGPVANLFSRGQMMNASFDPLHLVNTYGAFGSITRDRYEIVLQGTNESAVTDTTKWLDYEFKGKPGDPARLPPQVAPYHMRLDWLMWFEAMAPSPHSVCGT